MADNIHLPLCQQLLFAFRPVYQISVLVLIVWGSPSAFTTLFGWKSPLNKANCRMCSQPPPAFFSSGLVPADFIFPVRSPKTCLVAGGSAAAQRLDWLCCTRS